MPTKARARRSMRRSSGNGGGGNGDRRRDAGFPDPFAGFPDPFAGFGFGGNMMQSFFGGRDPFDDPFFSRPFGSMFGFPDHDLFARPREGGFLENRPFHSQQGNRRGPIIEEVDDDHPDATRSTQVPIVEHPDDDLRPERRQRTRQNGPLANQDGNGVQSYSFQSSSMSYGGPSGTHYSSSTARRRGPNGVVQEEHHEKDTSAKTETHRMSRGIYDKGHSLTRKRNAEGREESSQILHNIAEDEVADFEKRWENEAERNLPGWNRNGARALGGGRQRAALTSGGSSGARQA